MTCIVGVVDTDGSVVIGADTAGSNDNWYIVNRADGKVWEHDGWGFGFTDSYRMGQLLRYAFTPPPVTEGPLERYMVVDFIDAVRCCLTDGGFASKENEVEVGGTFLVAHAGRLFKIGSNYQVEESMHGFDATGCGDISAIGALHALPDDMPAEDKVRRALEVAERCSAGVRGPFEVVRVAA